MEYSRLDKWKYIINEIIKVIKDEFDNKISILEPIIKQILKEKRNLFGTVKLQSNDKNNLNQIINNNNLMNNINVNNNANNNNNVDKKKEDEFHSNMTSMVDDIYDSMKGEEDQPL